ncbi:MAG: hypothetical protein Q9161_009445 [Pseudevernia consocians]
MRPSLFSLWLALTATVVLASPKGQKYRAQGARSNATATATGSTASESTAGGWYYVHVVGPNPPTPTYTGCSLANGDTGSEPQPAYIFNLSSTYPPCTPQLDTNLYPSVNVEPGDPGMAMCESWIPAGGDTANGLVPLVQAYVDLCG